MGQEIQKSSANEVKNMLASMESQFASALMDQNVPTQKFIRCATTAITLNPDLLQADRKSLYSSVMLAAQDGLILDNREAALVIFNKKVNNNQWVKKVQYIPMVTGIIKKMQEYAGVATVTSHVVFEGEKFEIEYGDDEKIIHKPSKTGKPEKDKAIGVYAIISLHSGAKYRRYMTREEVMAVKGVSKTPIVWEGDFWDQQWEKTVIRRAAKRLPSHDKLDAVFKHDNDNYNFDPDDSVVDDEMEIPQEEPQQQEQTSAAAKAKARFAERNEQPPPPPEPKTQPPPTEGDIVDADFTEVPPENDVDDIPI